MATDQKINVVGMNKLLIKKIISHTMKQPRHTHLTVKKIEHHVVSCSH